MEKYMRVVLFCITACIGISAVSLVTYDKFADLHAKRAAVPYQFTSLQDRERQLKCMTQNIYWEAANEPAEGKLAVAQIVINRVESGKFPSDPCQVIFQKNVFYEKVVCQFSWYCERTHVTRPIHPGLWDESHHAAKMVLLEGFRLPGLKDALYYHADYVNPQWNKDKVTKIGRHIFYKDKQKGI